MKSIFTSGRDAFHRVRLSLLLLLTLSPLLLVSSAFAAPQIAWIARYSFGTNSDSKVFALALDVQQNLLVAGTSKNDQGNADYVTAKYSPTGSNLWTKRFDSSGTDTVRGFALDHDNNAILTGTSKTVKYGSDGTEQWAAPYGGRGVAIDSSNNVVVTGFSEVDFATVKLTPQGSNVWLRTFDRFARRDISQVVAVDSAGNMFVAGIQTYQCANAQKCYYDLYIGHYDADGTLQWMVTPRLAGLGDLTEVVAIGVDGNGDVVLAANCWGVPSHKYYVAKYSHAGQFVWSKYYAPTDGEGIRAMELDAAGNLYLTGGQYGWLEDEHVYYKTFKIAPDKSTLWEGTYSYHPNPSFNRAQAITLDAARNTYVTGQSTGLGTGSDWATIKYNADGQEQWVVRYDGALHGEDQATAIAVDNAGAIYVGGFTTTTNGIEMLLIKYVEVQNIQMQTNQNVLLQFLGTPGVSNRVQATTDFLGWLDLGFSVADTNGLIHFVDTNAPSHPFRFYRTVAP